MVPFAANNFETLPVQIRIEILFEWCDLVEFCYFDAALTTSKHRWNFLELIKSRNWEREISCEGPNFFMENFTCCMNWFGKRRLFPRSIAVNSAHFHGAALRVPTETAAGLTSLFAVTISTKLTPII